MNLKFHVSEGNLIYSQAWIVQFGLVLFGLAQFANELNISLSQFHYAFDAFWFDIFFLFSITTSFLLCMHSQIRQFFDTENLSNFRLHQIQYYVKLLIQIMQLSTVHSKNTRRRKRKHTTKLWIALDLVWSLICVLSGKTWIKIGHTQQNAWVWWTRKNGFKFRISFPCQANHIFEWNIWSAWQKPKQNRFHEFSNRMIALHWNVSLTLHFFSESSLLFWAKDYYSRAKQLASSMSMKGKTMANIPEETCNSIQICFQMHSQTSFSNCYIYDAHISSVFWHCVCVCRRKCIAGCATLYASK